LVLQSTKPKRFKGKYRLKWVGIFNADFLLYYGLNLLLNDVCFVDSNT
jgi:hypothetical protein